MRRTRQKRGRSPRDTALLIVPRQGSVESFPERCRIESCSKCGHAVWVRVALAESLERRGLKIKCLCFGGAHDCWCVDKPTVH
jgi:hypothetical protein